MARKIDLGTGIGAHTLNGQDLALAELGVEHIFSRHDAMLGRGFCTGTGGFL